MYVIKVDFEDGASITHLEKEELYDDGLELGLWETPFPKNGTASGIIEYLAQTDFFSNTFYFRVPKRVTISKSD